AEVATWLNWLTGQRITSLGQVTQDHCDRYLIERRRRKDTAGTVIGALEDASLRLPAAVVIELAGYGELFTTDRYADGFTPWRGRTSSRVAGVRYGGENKTPPLDPKLLQPLLAAAFYLTETLGPHLAGLRQAVRQDRLAHQELRSTWATLEELHSVLGRHIDTGEPLRTLGNAHIRARLTSGWAPDDPLLPVSFTALANTAGARRLGPGVAAEGRPAVLAVLDRVGTARPWGRGAAEVAAADGTAAIPWTMPLDTGEICDLTGLVRTACLIITAMITGMRRCELLEQHRHRARPGPLPAGREAGQGSGAGRPGRRVGRGRGGGLGRRPGRAAVRRHHGWCGAVRLFRLRQPVLHVPRLDQRAGRPAPEPGADPRRAGDPPHDAPQPGPGDRLPARRAARRTSRLEARQRGHYGGLQFPARRRPGETARRDRRVRGRTEPQPGRRGIPQLPERDHAGRARRPGAGRLLRRRRGQAGRRPAQHRRQRPAPAQPAVQARQDPAHRRLQFLLVQ